MGFNRQHANCTILVLLLCCKTGKATFTAEYAAALVPSLACASIPVRRLSMKRFSSGGLILGILLLLL